MSRSAENQNWAILAQHHYAQETMQTMHFVEMQAALVFPADELEAMLDTVEAGVGV